MSNVMIETDVLVMGAEPAGSISAAVIYQAVLKVKAGEREKVFFAKKPDLEIKQQLCSVLAGYVWDQNNPFVRDHERELKRLAKMIDVQQRLDSV